MKKIYFSFLLLTATAAVFIVNGCSKKEETPSTCKTCKAAGVDGAVQKQVCSDAEETAFRTANAGKQITCQ